MEEAVLNQKRIKLWLTVIAQATSEAEGEKMYDAEDEDKPSLIYRARKYLMTCSRSIQQVASLAGLKGEQVKLLIQLNKEKYDAR